MNKALTLLISLVVTLFGFSATNFYEPVNISGLLEVDGDTITILVNSSGQILTAWKSKDSDNIYAATKDGQKPWSDPILISTGSTANISTLPDIAINDSGQAIVAWNTSSKNIYVSRLNSFGSSWSDPILVSLLSSADDSERASISMNDSGEVALAWRSASGSKRTLYVSTSKNSGNTWSAPQILDTNLRVAETFPQIAINNRGQMSVGWTRHVDSKINVYTSSVNVFGSSWSSPTLLSVGASLNDSLFRRLAINKFGQVSVVWDSTNGVYASTRNAFNESWRSPTLLSTGDTEGISEFSHIALNNLGQVAVTWRTLSNGNHNVYVSTLSAFNSTWSQPQLISTGLLENISRAPRIAMNNKGQIVIAWFSNQNDIQNVYISALSSFDGAWSTPRLVSTFRDVLNLSAKPQISMNDQGETTIAFLEDLTDLLYFADGYVYKLSDALYDTLPRNNQHVQQGF